MSGSSSTKIFPLEHVRTNFNKANDDNLQLLPSVTPQNTHRTTFGVRPVAVTKKRVKEHQNLVWPEKIPIDPVPRISILPQHYLGSNFERKKQLKYDSSHLKKELYSFTKKFKVNYGYPFHKSTDENPLYRA